MTFKMSIQFQKLNITSRVIGFLVVLTSKMQH